MHTQNHINGAWTDCCVQGAVVKEWRCPGSPPATCNDGIQNQGETGVDCGGPCPPCCVDNDGDGHFAISGSCSSGYDCNDNDAAIYPGATEICDGKDNGCNGLVDEICSGQTPNNICIGSSANAGSGNLYHSQTLFTIPNAKPSLDISLSYNSLDFNTGAFGRGWTHGFNITLTPNPDGSLRLKGPDGNTTYFRLSGGIYYPDPQSGDTSKIVKNPDNTYTQTHKDGIVYTFSTSGLLTEIKDMNGNATTLAYTGDDLTSITDSTGRVTSFTVNSGKIASITDPKGSVYTFTYTGDLLTAVTAPLSNTWTYGYDGYGKMTTKTDPKGNTITYAYDAYERLASSTDPFGKTKTINYDQTNNIATIIEKDSGVWLQKYDPLLNVPLEKTDPDGNKTTYTYNSKRNLLTETDPLGHTTTYTYDSNGNMTSATDALGKTITYTYNALNKITSITDQTGGITTFTYDAKGNLLTKTDPTGAITRFTYDSKGNVISITDPKNQTTTITYDQYNNPITIKDAAGTVFIFTYDIMGNLLSSPNPPTTYEYNSLNQLIKITDALNNITTFTYDANGNRQAVTDAEGNTTTYEHNYKGQVTNTTDALGYITAYAYGSSGCPSCSENDKLTSVTDAKGGITSYEYDKRGNLKKETGPLGYATAYTYDGANNLISKTDAKGNTITYTYDAVNRLTKKTYPDATTETFTYYAKGNILTAANQNISYTFTYDADNRLTKVTDSKGKTLQYTYDANSNRLTMTDPAGGITTYAYNALNLVTSIKNPANKTFSFAYDTLMRRTQITYPNNFKQNYTYDTASRITSQILKTSKGATVDSYTYTYDKVANRKTMADTTGTHNYAYDRIYQLTQATHPTIPAEQYTYDAVGNRTTTTVDTANRLLDDGTFAYTYDNNGNLIRKVRKANGETTTYSYDYENRLIQVLTPNSQLITYKYDPFGRRIEKKVGTTITTYVYDNEDIIAEYNAGVTMTNRYTHGLGIDEPLSIRTGGKDYYYHSDSLNSIKTITGSTGKTVQKYEYDSFGRITYQLSQTFKQPYSFTVREYDSETGLYYYRARYYDPQIGRFISKDPIGFAGGDVNLFRYVGNNPVNKIDPKGLCSWTHAIAETIVEGLEALCPHRISLDPSECILARDSTSGDYRFCYYECEGEITRVILIDKCNECAPTFIGRYGYPGNTVDSW